MTWAPLGILRTVSDRVGRTTTNRRPVLPRTEDPSGVPMRESWATMPDVGVEGRTGPEVDEVPALLGVDQQHPLAVPEDAPIPVGRHPVQRPSDVVGDRRMLVTVSRSPGFSTVR